MKKYFIVLGGALLIALIAAGCDKAASPEVSVGEKQGQETPEHQAIEKKAAGENREKVRAEKEKKPADTRYVNYSAEAFAKAQSKKRVYFFHATWCPTCAAADAEFSAGISQIPTDVVVFKTDYDTETALKTKYGVIYQHTFVLVDSSGKEIKKWNGGALAEVVANTR